MKGKTYIIIGASALIVATALYFTLKGKERSKLEKA